MPLPPPPHPLLFLFPRGVPDKRSSKLPPCPLILLTHKLLTPPLYFLFPQEEFQANAAVAAASSSSFLSAQGLAASQMSAAGYLMGTPYPPSQYPPYAPAPHVAPPGAGYRYPLLPGYPPPRPATPVAPVAAVAAATRLSERPGHFFDKSLASWSSLEVWCPSFPALPAPFVFQLCECVCVGGCVGCRGVWVGCSVCVVCVCACVCVFMCVWIWQWCVCVVCVCVYA